MNNWICFVKWDNPYIVIIILSKCFYFLMTNLPINLKLRPKSLPGIGDLTIFYGPVMCDCCLWLACCLVTECDWNWFCWFRQCFSRQGMMWNFLHNLLNKVYQKKTSCNKMLDLYIFRDILYCMTNFESKFWGSFWHLIDGKVF